MLFKHANVGNVIINVSQLGDFPLLGRANNYNDTARSHGTALSVQSDVRRSTQSNQ